MIICCRIYEINILEINLFDIINTRLINIIYTCIKKNYFT